MTDSPAHDPDDPTASRTVKPRKLAKPCTLPVVAITHGLDTNGNPQTYALAENSGSLLTLDEYAEQLYGMPRTLVVTFGAENLLWAVHDRWRKHPRWTWRVTVTQKGRQLRKRVSYFGFKDAAKKQNRYHLVIDANSFLRGHDKSPDNLLELGIEIRQFCNDHGLAVRASASGIATQLLRHPLFYPVARRQVPTFINEAVRPHLPGGHYESYADNVQRVEAVHYIDQKNAHHYAAMKTPLPNANSVRAQGYTRESERVWARRGGRLYERAMKSHGLVRAYARIPDLTYSHRDQRDKIIRGPADFVPRLLRTPGKRVVHLWTNEIPYLEQHGLEIEYLIAGWGTEEVDNGLAKYAQWATQQADRYPHLKPLLLMPYGLLGQHSGTVTFHHPHGPDSLLLANRFLEGTTAVQTTVKPTTANALQLGLIQSFVRSLSLDFAQQASTSGHDVVSIYVDGVFIRLTKGKQLPIFAPWRVKEEYEQVELDSSLRVPVRAKVKRDFALVK